ncbi:MAG: signal peptide peptidase SppA [Planctomycetota bacterium]|nr:signal peptide peptidase SppA [Planctomycetota bacterium]MDA1212088.1 signal peptide peptidase SppA [Planctomycetota bacterium]
MKFIGRKILCFSSLALVSLCLLSADSFAQKKEEKPKPAKWGHIEITGDYAEGTAAPGIFGELTETLNKSLERLAKAEGDENLVGVILHIKQPAIGLGKLNEFREAIARVRGKGKKVVAWMDEGTTKDYLLASACDEIVVPESGSLMVVGLRMEVTFYKELLDWLNVEFDVLRVGEYKAAAEPFTRVDMSPEYRQEMEAILDDNFSEVVRIIAESRKLESDQVKELIDQGPFTANEALERGLIDRVAYEDELETLLKPDGDERDVQIVRRYGKSRMDADFTGFAGFMNMMNLLTGVDSTPRKTRTPKIAVIHATGMIVTGKSTTDILGSEAMGSETIIKAIETARDDDSVIAVVLRIDSPGGSALASDLMWRALEKLDKPLVASMGDVAASGGYYIAMGADYIYAEPGTLTGSIGVIGGKLATEGLYNKIGIKTTVLSRGANSGLFTSSEKFSETERAAMTKLLYAIYDQFTGKAAQGRKMEQAELEKLARGRVYTGSTAVKIGLVDELGTLHTAMQKARELGKIGADEKVEELHLPRAVSPLEQLLGPIDEDVRMPASLNVLLRSTAGGRLPEWTSRLPILRDVIPLLRLGTTETRWTLMPCLITIE